MLPYNVAVVTAGFFAATLFFIWLFLHGVYGMRTPWTFAIGGGAMAVFSCFVSLLIIGLIFNH